MKVEMNHVTFTYPGAPVPALFDSSLLIPSGGFCLVVGPSGAGKSTLLRAINGLVPHFAGGRISGCIRVGDHDPIVEGPQVLSRYVGFVFQDPEAQCVMDRVEDEVAFGLENAAIPPSLMEERITHVLNALAISHLRHRRIETLSGGERQRVAMAAALVLQPSVLVLDEPTSQLDSESAADVLDAIVALHKTLGLTVVMSEHRLERVLEYVDQVILVQRDGTVTSGEPEEILARADSVPPLLELGKRLGWNPLPMTMAEGEQRVQQALSDRSHVVKLQTKGLTAKQDRVPSLLRVRDLVADYGDETILDAVSFDLMPGQLVALMGRNGTGKTTLLRSVVGLHRRRAGEVMLDGRLLANTPSSETSRQIGYLPQRPDDLLFADTVLQELQVTLRNHGLLDTPPISCDELLSSLDLAPLAGLYPRDLSVGQRRRVALAAIMVTKPSVLLLDEPTRGLDAALKKQLATLLRAWCRDGGSVLVSTHDVEMMAELADVVMLLQHGHIVSSGTPEDVLPLLGKAGPQMARLLPGRRCVTVEQAVDFLT